MKIGAKVLSRSTSGNVTINGTIMHIAQDDLPFGGVGASGREPSEYSSQVLSSVIGIE